MPSAGFQVLPYQLPSVTYSAGGTATTTLRDIPKTLLGRLVHVAGIQFDVQATPTLNSGAVTKDEMQNVVTRLEITDGNINRFTGSFKSLRFKEILENGKLLSPDSDDLATTEVGAFSRYWSVGPQQFAGAPSDFVLPAGALENAEIKYGFGALTDIDAQCTAMSCTITPVAWIVLLDELRIPPVYEWAQYTAGAADLNITGRALYPFLALFNSSSFDAISAGDFASITVDCGGGTIINTDAEVLTHAYHAHMLTGHVTPVMGEPRASTHDGAKIVNGGTPTALVGATAAIQPVLWAAPGAKITKIAARAESVCRVRWGGANGSGTVAMVGRILEQPDGAIAAMAAKALGRLGLAKQSAKIKTLSKDLYTGPSREFMPYAIKVS